MRCTTEKGTRFRQKCTHFGTGHGCPQFFFWNLNLWHLLYCTEESKQILAVAAIATLMGIREIRSQFAVRSSFVVLVGSLCVFRFFGSDLWPKPLGSSFVAG